MPYNLCFARTEHGHTKAALSWFKYITDILAVLCNSLLSSRCLLTGLRWTQVCKAVPDPSRTKKRGCSERNGGWESVRVGVWEDRVCQLSSSGSYCWCTWPQDSFLIYKAPPRSVKGSFTPEAPQTTIVYYSPPAPTYNWLQNVDQKHTCGSIFHFSVELGRWVMVRMRFIPGVYSTHIYSYCKHT